MSTPKRHFHALLPVDRRLFEIPLKGRWRAKVSLWPSSDPTGELLLHYQIQFQRLDRPTQRFLKLSVSRDDLELHHCQADILAYLTLWLEAEDGDAEFTLRWDEESQIVYRHSRRPS